MTRLLGLIPGWAWAILLVLALAWGGYEHNAGQTAQIDAQAARTALAMSEAKHERERATAAVMAAEAAAQAVADQQAHARRQTEVLDALEFARSANAALGRDRDGAAARADRLRRDIAARIAADAARDRAQAGADTAASACARRAAELGDLLEQGVDLAAEGAGLVDQLRARLGAAARIIGNDRALMSRPHSQ